MRLKAELKKLSEGNLAIGSGNKMDGPVTTVDDVLPKDAPAPNTGASQPAAKKASKPAKEGASAAPEAPARSKRDRQQVEFYTDNLKQSEAFTVQQGKGSQLADIPNVKYRLQEHLTGSDEVLLQLHSLIFRRPGKLSTRKKDIAKFSGFTYPADKEADERAKDVAKAKKLTVPHINAMLDLFDISRGSGEAGKKDQQIERLLDFLQEPKPLGKQDTSDKASKKSKAAPKAAKAKAKPAKAGESDAEAADQEPAKPKAAKAKADRADITDKAAKPAKAAAAEKVGKPAKAKAGKAKADGAQAAEPEAPAPSSPKAKAEKASKAAKPVSTPAKAQDKGKEAAQAKPKAAGKGTAKRKAGADEAKPAKRTKAAKKDAPEAPPPEVLPSDEELEQATEEILAQQPSLRDYNLQELLEALGKRFPGLDFQKHKDKRTLVKMTAIKRAGVRMGRKALQAARDAAAAAYAGYNSSDTEGAADEEIEEAMQEADDKAQDDKQLEDMITGAAADGPELEAAAGGPPQEESAKQALDSKDVNVKNTELHLNTEV